MTDIAKRIAALSPEKRALLEEKLAAANSTQRKQASAIERYSGPPIASFGQERLWFLEQIEGGTPLYNISVAIRLRGSLDTNAVAVALNSILQRHDSLRTRYLSQQGALYLVVDEGAVLDLPLNDLSGLSHDEQMYQLESELKAEARRVMRIDTDLMIRAALFRLSADDHTLQITLHHIASDGWSLSILFREFAAFYNQATTGREANFTELPVRYSDYARWLRETVRGAELERLTSYWSSHLGSGAHALQLPTDRPRPAAQSFIGEQRSYQVPERLKTALNEFCRREGVTPFMAFLASLYSVLGRYSGQSSIVIGTPVAARAVADVEGLIGFFTNTLAVRADIDDDPTFRELVHRVKRATLGAFEHQNVAFEKVIERLKPERDLSRSPLFQVMFVLQNTPAQELDLHGLSASTREIHTGTAKFDITIAAEERAGKLQMAIEYSTALFDASTIDRLWTHLSSFLDNAVASPNQEISAIPLLTDTERHQLIDEWNATERDYPRQASLAELIESQVNRTPNSIAVQYENDRITYAELNARANQLARALVKHGAGPDKLVGICVDRSIEMMVALLAVVKSGAAYVPLDPFLPADRMGYMIEDSGITILVTQGHIRPSLPSTTANILSLDDATEADGWKANQDANLNVVVGPEQLAYVIYTSGSTGKPKGVEVSRGSLSNLLFSMLELLDLSERDRLLAVTTISFDIAGADVWMPWLVGAQSILTSRDQAADGEYLRDVVARDDITFLQATPITWRLLLGAGWQGKADLQIVCTGEAMPPELARKLIPLAKRVWNLYGPTETTIWSTAHLVDGTDAPILIGRPIGNTECYVLDRHLQPVPIGVSGELYIAGAGVARGYRNRPELTAEKFVPDPFRRGQRMYKTGDLARFLPDGNIECLGRTDHQVKIRGFRIELGEIESVLKQYPGVSQAVVVAREDTPGDKRLVAYVVAASESIDPAELRSYLKQSLPDYMLPAAYVPLDSIPLTPNGKIDRNALPAPDDIALVSTKSAVLARTYVEKQLSEIWEEIFSVNEISVDDDFFDLGGHSLLAVSLMAKVAQVFGKRLPLNTLFESPTIAQLAEHIQEDQKTVGQHTLVSIQASGSRPPIYWIPGGAALGLFRLRHIVTRLGPEQPVYGLGSSHPKSLEDVESVEQRAGNYLELVRKVQPHGPYCIAGFCAGGRVAYEMAQRLVADGETVAFLGMINCWFPNYPNGRVKLALFKLDRLRHQLRRARTEGTSVVGYVKKKLANRRYNKAEAQRIAEARDVVAKSGFEQTNATQNQVLLEATIQKFEWYKPQRYNGRVSLFISDDEAVAGVRESLDPRFAWIQTAASFEVRTFPGGHEAVLEMPYAETFAETLQAALENALKLTT